ncbi:MAG: glycosyltransferase [Pseudobdellovibrionaceae bacterium]
MTLNKIQNPLNILFFCQSIDETDSAVGDTAKRVLSLAADKRVKNILVIAVKGSKINLGEKVTVEVLSDKNTSKLRLLLKFYIVAYHRYTTMRFEICYLYMTPSMAILFLPFKLFFKCKIAIWFAHTVFTWKVRLSIFLISDLWLSANRAQAQLSTSKLRIIGQGVDLSQFYPMAKTKEFDLLTVGRISSSKKIELMLFALQYLNENYDKKYTLTICGECYSKSDFQYKKQLEKLIVDLNLVGSVYFIGSVEHKNLCELLNTTKVFLFTTPGGLGKATIEAMACGIPTVIAEEKLEDFLDNYLMSVLVCRPLAESIAAKIYTILNLPESEYKILSHKINRFANNKCSMQNFSEKVVDELLKTVKQGY